MTADLYYLTATANGETITDSLLLDGPLVEQTIRINRRGLWSYLLRGGLTIVVRTDSVEISDED